MLFFLVNLGHDVFTLGKVNTLNYIQIMESGGVQFYLVHFLQVFF